MKIALNLRSLAWVKHIADRTAAIGDADAFK